MIRDSTYVKLAHNWTVNRVSDCLANDQQHELVRFLRERYTERFLEPIRFLSNAEGNERGFGFAIMGLCCLLIETIECYRLGWPSSHCKDLDNLAKRQDGIALPQLHYKVQGPFESKTLSSRLAFERFFQEPKHQLHFPGVDGQRFYEDIRCGLLHQAQTKGGWRIIRSGKYWDDSPEERTINRDEFSERLKDCFDAFVSELSMIGWNEDLWKNVRKKVWWLAQTS